MSTICPRPQKHSWIYQLFLPLGIKSKSKRFFQEKSRISNYLLVQLVHLLSPLYSPVAPFRSFHPFTLMPPWVKTSFPNHCIIPDHSYSCRYGNNISFLSSIITQLTRFTSLCRGGESSFSPPAQGTRRCRVFAHSLEDWHLVVASACVNALSRELIGAQADARRVALRKLKNKKGIKCNQSSSQADCLHYYRPTDRLFFAKAQRFLLINSSVFRG